MFSIQKCNSHYPRLCQPGIRVLVLAIVFIAFAVFSLQSFTLTKGNSPAPAFGKATSSGISSSEELGEVPRSRDSRTQEVEKRGLPVAGVRDEHHPQGDETDGDPDDFDLDGEESQDEEFSIDVGNDVGMRKVKDPYGGYITQEKSLTAGNSSSVGMDDEPSTGFTSTSSEERERSTSLEMGWEKGRNLGNTSSSPASLLSRPESSSVGEDTQVKQGNKSSDSGVNVGSGTSISSSGRKETESPTIARREEKQPLHSGVTNPNHGIAKRIVRTRRRKTVMTIAEMEQVLLKNRGSSGSMRPQWPSPSDRQILKAKAQILNAPIVENDPELYAPAFRNLSVFKRSYDLMEKMLKVYVYEEGEKPIFHQPHLTGIYASEAWFMKHMKGSQHFVVDNPTKAHLFYMPFSSTSLRLELYDVRLHNERKMVDYLKNYVGLISGKHPFWNRTSGADHFLAGCHDMAPRPTARAMGNSIRALCNADVSDGFRLGMDVSLPETVVHKEQDPTRDLGGRPARKRPVLAFFAGQMHGYLRPLLLRHWENRDPDMKVFGPLSRRGGGRHGGPVYAQYMKSSKYCICPRGNEVNSPRVVEALFYGCVPVIISDNFVPPLFGVLNWEAFSVVVAESDVPRLKDVLASIPMNKYLALQEGVRRVQRHFLWHKQPVKYDLFHMILHSVWFNRVFNFQA